MSSLLTLSMNFEAMQRVFLLVDSSGTLLLPSSVGYPKINQSIHYFFVSFSHTSSYIDAPSFQIRINSTVFLKSCPKYHVLFPFWLPRTSVPCPPDCLILLCRLVLPLKLSGSRCSLIKSTQVIMQPSESSLNSFDFLKVFLDFPPPISLDSVFLVANCSNVLIIISQVFAYVMASGDTRVCTFDSPGGPVEFAAPPFNDVFIVSDTMILWI